MPFRDSIRAVSPPWLLNAVADGIQFAEGMALDALDTWVREGVKARFPGVSSNDAMGYISHDRNIEQGPTEGWPAFALRLKAAFDTWVGAGNAYTLITQLQTLWVGAKCADGIGTLPSIRLVSNGAIWFESVAGGATTNTVGDANWIWDTLSPTRWWRGWAIIDQGTGTTGILWTQDLWGPANGTWGDGFMWGASGNVAPYTSGGITPDQSAYLIRMVGKWKPENVAAMVLMTFSPEVFDVDGIPGGGVNPNDSMSDPTKRLTFNALYSSEII